MTAYEASVQAQRPAQASQLREEIAQLQRQLRQAELGPGAPGGPGGPGVEGGGVRQKLLQLEREKSCREMDAHNLRQQVRLFFFLRLLFFVLTPVLCSCFCSCRSERMSS